MELSYKATSPGLIAIQFYYAEKGMLSWRGVLKPAEIQAVASHIHTLRGSNPPDPKPPEDPSRPAVPMDFE